MFSFYVTNSLNFPIMQIQNKNITRIQRMKTNICIKVYHRYLIRKMLMKVILLEVAKQKVNNHTHAHTFTVFDEIFFFSFFTLCLCVFVFVFVTFPLSSLLIYARYRSSCVIWCHCKQSHSHLTQSQNNNKKKIKNKKPQCNYLLEYFFDVFRPPRKKDEKNSNTHISCLSLWVDWYILRFRLNFFSSSCNLFRLVFIVVLCF